MSDTGMKPIWYFAGLMLFTMGTLIFIAGIIGLISPSGGTTVLAETHPRVWWGAIMAAFGGILYWKTRKQRL